MRILDTVFVYRLQGKDGRVPSDRHSGERLSWHGRYHAHGSDEFELHFFLEGSGAFQCNRARYPISGGRVFLTGPYDFHSIVPEAVSSPLTYYAVLFDFDDSQGPHDQSLSRALRATIDTRATLLSIDPHFRFQFEDLLLMAKSSDPALKESALHLLQSFLYRWFCRDSGMVHDNITITGRANRLHAAKALSLMERHVRDNVSVEEFALKVGLSEEHFIRTFRDEVHMTPHQYFMRLKVEGASGLLMSTDKTVGQIAEWFGFENQFHFSRIFRKCTGMSPIQYRKTYLQLADFS